MFNQKNYNNGLPDMKYKKITYSFYNCVAYIMQMQYKHYIQKTIQVYTEFVCDPEVKYIL